MVDEYGDGCPKCGSDNITGFRQYDTQKPDPRLVGHGEKCLDCGAWWKLGEWSEYPKEADHAE